MLWLTLSISARGVGWFIEGILPLAALGKSRLSIKFENCITNDDRDPSIDMMKEVSLGLLRAFGVGQSEETVKQLSIEIKARGAPPKGGGVVNFSCPIARQLKPIDYTDAGSTPEAHPFNMVDLHSQVW